MNKLGEYLTAAKASRRERILRDAKFPPTYKVIRYEPTRQLIQRYFAGKIRNLTELAEAIDEYALSPVSDDFEARMKKSNLEAMERFAAWVPSLDFGDVKITLDAHAPPRRQIAGVSVSIQPELYLTAGGGPNVPIRRGAIKLNVAKTAVHGKDAAEYVGALVRQFVEEGGLPDECDHQLCYSLDVFGEKLVTSPKAVVNRMRDIEATCGEIARQWPSITSD